jgi:hypothetical protein
MTQLTITLANAQNIQPVTIDRVDQTITWVLGENLQWDHSSPSGSPIEFQGAEGEFAAWPGTDPTPVGTLAFGTPDRRVYEANGNSPNLTDEVIKYHYLVHLLPLVGGDRIKVGRPGQGVPWIDPDVENQPKP